MVHASISTICHLAKVIAVRIRHRRRPERMPDGPAQVGFNRVSSWAREASDLAQLALPLAQAAAGVIPVAGGPLQATFHCLQQVLQTIDTSISNKSDLEQLTARICLLVEAISQAPDTWDPHEVRLREKLKSSLEETARKLGGLGQHRRFAYKSVTQTLASCNRDVTNYVLEYSAMSQMISQERSARSAEAITEMHSLFFQARAPTSPTATQVIGYVILVDATDREHCVPQEYCTSFEQLQAMLVVIFKRDFPGSSVQRRYLEAGQYDLCIDDGRRVTEVTDTPHGWRNFDPGTKVCMRVIFQQKQHSFEVYGCQLCGAPNKVECCQSVSGLSGWVTEGSVICGTCGGRFQVSLKEQQAADPHAIDTGTKIDNQTRACIRNYRIDILCCDSLLLQLRTLLAQRDTHECFAPDICQWQTDEGVMCGETIDCATASVHFGAHVSGVGGNTPVQCSWVGCGSYISRKKLLRHVRERHLGHSRFLS